EGLRWYFPLFPSPCEQESFMHRAALLSLALGCALAAPAAAADPECTRKQDVIYGRKYGVALTMDVFSPKKNPNGAGVILVVRGGSFSSGEGIQPPFYPELLRRGYTVFAVVHGSQPKFTLPEIVADVNRAVRFIRSHAKDYSVDPDRLGIAGGSAGGHLSLMIGTAGTKGDPKAADPGDREPSRGQAGAAVFPPGGFPHWGKGGGRKPRGQ